MYVDKVKKFIENDQEKIAGWFFGLDQVIFFELFAMQNQYRAGGDIVEVGVYQGKSLVLLSLLKNQNENLLGFDLFGDDHEQITLENMALYGDGRGLKLIKGMTGELGEGVLEELLPAPLRMLHIDAGHEYHEVLEQLMLFSPFVADAGIIAMDDYQDREFPGIEAAVLDFASIDRPRRFVPFFSGGNKIYLCASHFATTFQQFLIQQPNFKDRCRLSRVRDFNVLIARSKLPVSSENIEVQLSALVHPRRGEEDSSLNDRSRRFAQVAFGSGKG